MALIELVCQSRHVLMYKNCLTNRSNLNFRCIGVISASYFFCPKTLKKHFHGTVNCKL